MPHQIENSTLMKVKTFLKTTLEDNPPKWTTQHEKLKSLLEEVKEAEKLFVVHAITRDDLLVKTNEDINDLSTGNLVIEKDGKDESQEELTILKANLEKIPNLTDKQMEDISQGIYEDLVEEDFWDSLMHQANEIMNPDLMHVACQGGLFLQGICNRCGKGVAEHPTLGDG